MSQPDDLHARARIRAAVLDQVAQHGNDEILAGSERGDPAPSAFSQAALTPFQRYLVQALVDGSPTMARLFDQMIGMTKPVAQTRGSRPQGRAEGRPARPGGRAERYGHGHPVLREHISRVACADMFSPEGYRHVALAALDIYPHALLSPELAESARAGLGAAQSPPLGEQRRR
jgi:hypothetical protein